MASDDGMRRRQCCGLPSGLVRWAGSGWSPGGGGWREILQALRREGWLWRYDVEYDCIRVRGMTRVTMQHNLPVDRHHLIELGVSRLEIRNTYRGEGRGDRLSLSNNSGGC